MSPFPLPRVAPVEISLASSGAFPNSPLPVLYYPGVLEGLEECPEAVEELFYSHNWKGAWVNGVYPFDHFHSTTHEVLAVVSGRAKLRLGGPSGKGLEVGSKDVLVLPAGVAHARIWASPGFLVVGAYPEGRSWDLRRGDPGELPLVLVNLSQVPLPTTDPVYGKEGPLPKLWRDSQGPKEGKLSR